METLPALRVVAVCLGCAAGACAAIWLHGRPRRGAGYGGARARSASERLLWRMRNGVGPLTPLSRRLLRLPPVARFAGRVSSLACERGVATTEEACLSVALAAELAVAIAAFAVCGSAAGAVAVAACAAVAAGQGAKAREEARRESLREAVPEALRSLADCFQSGLTLPQAFERQASELPSVLGSLFREASSRMQLGAGAHEALDYLRRASGLSELSFVAVALDVQHETGGSMRSVLDSTRAVVEDQLELKRSLRVQTAQAKLSARIVTLLPFVLVALFSLVSEGFLAPFFESFAGMALLAMAVAMQVAGVFAVRRVLEVNLS